MCVFKKVISKHEGIYFRWTGRSFLYNAGRRLEEAEEGVAEDFLKFPAQAIERRGIPCSLC